MNKLCLIKILFICITLLASAPSHADMLISPTRLFMDNENRSASMILRNSSDGPRTYRLSWQDKRALPSGGYDLIEASEEWPMSAKDMLRFSPRQITVGPKENQTVRFNWRPPADLPTGEYRSHLLLQVIPEISEPSSSVSMDGPEESIGIQLTMQMSFSIPVVVRNNASAPEISITDVKAVPSDDGKRMSLQVAMSHSGIASSYGKVVVEMQRSSDSPVEKIGEIKEFAIYPEIDTRKVNISLRDSSIPAGSIVRVAYEGIEHSSGITWTEKIFQIN